MSSGWSECSLGDLIDIRHGFAFSGDYISKNQGKFVLVTPGNFEIGGGFKEGSAKYFHGQYPEEYIFSPGDLVVTMTDLSKTADTLGYSAKIPGEKGKTYLHNQRVGKVSSKSSDAELDFLYWVMRHTDYRRWVLSTATGSTVKHTSPSRILDYTFLLPPIQEQKAIAHILGTLDDKIELNRKTNQTLEAMAKALFKSWFVDFDPVRAKAEGRPTGLPAEISDLFPDSFEDSELGEIPSGWSIEELGNLYTIGKGGIWGDDTCSGDEFKEVSCLRGIDCHNLASGSIPVVPSRWVKRSQVESRIPEDGAILIEGSGSFCGRSLLWEEKYLQLFERAVVYSNFCKRLAPTCSKVYTPVVWMALRGCYDSNEVANFRTGTAFPNLDTSGLLKGISIVLPSEGVAAAFQDSYYLRNRVDLMAQSALLSNIRDALLPKLISGEIRIPDAEKMLEEVVL